MTSNPWPYVIAAFAVTAAVLGAYAAFVVQRGKELAKRVPPTRRRWIDQQVDRGAAADKAGGR